ncbi:MAG: hypothetical protein F6J86_16185 [Symploca sp. SIO1B1]|nr:hypothetical protein [Symploca sp. SIO1A3]NER95351.1 hypothetical protein [Symploca sp. SIO1B1]
MPRKSRYNQEIVETICEAIATEGGDEVGWLAGGIGKTTFYKWIEDKPEFRDAVVHAREEFRKRCPKYQKGLALQKLTDALENGQPIKWTTKKTRRLEHYVPGRKGQPPQLKWHQEETVTEEHTEHRPAPKWAIERVIPRPIEDDINAAIAFIERHGFRVVADGEIPVINPQNGSASQAKLPPSPETN